jgi:hypothetical protein
VYIRLYKITLYDCLKRLVGDRSFNRNGINMPTLKRTREIEHAYAPTDKHDNESFCMIDPYETCKDDKWSSDDEDECGSTPRARARSRSVFQPMNQHCFPSSVTFDRKTNDRCMLWFNDFSKIDGKSASGEQLFELYIMTCVRSNNISMPVDERTNSNTMITHTAMHIIRAKNSGQITASQYDDFIRVIHDYRKATPAQKMVEYIVRIHRCNPLLLGRIFGVFRALSKSAAAAYLHCLLSSCALDQYNLSISFIMKMCSIVLERKSLASVLDWIKTTQHEKYRENQMIPLNKLCQTVLCGLIVYAPYIYTNPTLSSTLLSSIDRHYTKECNTSLTKSGLFKHIELLKTYEFPMVELIALEHMIAMNSKEGVVVMQVRRTLDWIVRWCIAHQTPEYEELSEVRPVYTKLVQSMHKRVVQRWMSRQLYDVQKLENTSELVKQLKKCR